jgi:hypothetical protein
MERKANSVWLYAFCASINGFDRREFMQNNPLDKRACFSLSSFQIQTYLVGIGSSVCPVLDR